jgi:Secretion system C-terminal sorting domain/PKD domain
MESKFYKPTGFVSGICVSFGSILNKAVKSFLFFALFQLAYFSGLTQTSLSFSQISSDFARPGAGAEVWIGQYTMNIPGGLDLYWRFHWASDFQPGSSSRTTYNFSEFDRVIHMAIDKNQKFAFDIMERCGACGTDSKPNVGGAGMVYPQWLHNAMQSESVKDWVSKGEWVPNWNSSNYINGWKELNQAIYNHIMNTSYNGVPYKNVIRYIGAGGYGDYGEWTNNPFNGPAGSTATPATLKAIIDGTVQSYPIFQIVALEATYDGNLLPNTQIPPEVGYYALTTSNARGKLGYRRESWGDPTWFNDAWSINNNTVYNGLNFGQAISNIYTYAPVVGEPLDLGVTNHYADIMRQFNSMHVNSCGNGNFDGEQNNGTAVANFTAAIKAAGYNITLTGGNISGNAVTLNWQNSGLSPTYEDWDVTFELRNGNSVIYSQKSNFKPKLFIGTNASTDNLNGSGTGDLYLIIRDPNGYRKPLPLAISGRNTDGSYLLKANVTLGTGAPVNQPPIANAGADQNITLPVNSVTINGSSSSDPDGSIAGFQWTKISGPAQFTIGNSVSAGTTVSNLAAGVYSFQLKVTDNAGAIAQDTIKVIVNAAPANQPPVANAGADIAITLPANLVNLNGTASTDPDGTISIYAWSQVSGPAQATILSPANPSTTASGLQQGVYVFSLTVTDNTGVTATDNLTVTVNAVANTAPVANAGNSKSITLPVNSTTLDGSLSSDADGSIAGYSWAQISGPSASTITAGNTSQATVSGMVAGQYIFELTVTDNKGATSKSSVKITVSNSGVQPPVANAGADRSITLPTNTVTIDGSASSASSGSIVSYVWAEKSGPSTVNLTNTAQNTINNLQAGVYIFYLTVTDNLSAKGTDSVIITVIPVVNRAPVADAGVSISLTLPNNSTSLDGSKSFDPDGTISKYQWARISGPNMPATMGANAAIVNLGGLIAGTYLYQLTVTDNKGASSSGEVKVIVTAGANKPPVANAGANQSITAPASSVNLNGSASSDADGRIVTYNWVTVSGPGSITINNSNTAAPSVIGLQPGGYVFELTVTDNQGATAKDQVAVTVLPQSLQPNQPPVANAGTNLTITVPVNSVSLTGTSSFDPDGTIASYSWRQISGPSVSVLGAANTSTPTASQLIVGQYIFELTVTDNNGVKNTDQVRVTVNPGVGKVNLPPVASAGSNVTLELPNNSYTLNATGSKDPDGTIQTYQWQQIGGPNTVKSSNMGVPQVAISDFQPGEYEFQVVVTDNEGATSTAVMKLTVEPATGITDRFMLFPNPAHDITNAKITSTVTGTVKIFVYDMNGREVLVTEAEKTDDVVTKTLNISPLASGMYTVQIVIGNKKTMVTKFVKN